MQDAIFYVAAGETLGVVRDYANAKNVSAPTLVRGVSARLRMRIFARKEGPEPYPMDALADIVRWQWAMDSDFNEATSYKLQANNASITLSEVQDDIDGDEFTYTEVSIPIPDTNSEELAAWIGTDKSKGGLHGELVGYDGSGAEVFILQVENFTLRNRITSVGDMKASVYDADGDGVADRAKRADAADSVAWGNIADRPDTFTPATHTHGMADISDPVRQRTASGNNPRTLCLDSISFKARFCSSSSCIYGITSYGMQSYLPAKSSTKNCSSPCCGC